MPGRPPRLEHGSWTRRRAAVLLGVTVTVSGVASGAAWAHGNTPHQGDSNDAQFWTQLVLVGQQQVHRLTGHYVVLPGQEQGEGHRPGHLTPLAPAPTEAPTTTEPTGEPPTTNPTEAPTTNAPTTKAPATHTKTGGS